MRDCCVCLIWRAQGWALVINLVALSPSCVRERPKAVFEFRDTGIRRVFVNKVIFFRVVQEKVLETSEFKLILISILVSYWLRAIY